MNTVNRTGMVPKIYVLLQKNRSQIENLIGADEEKHIQEKIEEEQ
jgi:hypothetical protein